MNDPGVDDYARWAKRGRRGRQRPLHDLQPTRTATATWHSAPTAVRGMAGGRPWLLMEHSTSAVNWQPRQPRQAGG